MRKNKLEPFVRNQWYLEQKKKYELIAYPFDFEILLKQIKNKLNS